MFIKLILLPLYFQGAKHPVWQTNWVVPFVASRSRWALDGVYELKRRNQGHPSNYERDRREHNEQGSARENRASGRSMREGIKTTEQLILVYFLSNKSVSAGKEACLVLVWVCNEGSFKSLQKSTVIRTCSLHCHLLFASSLCWTICACPVEHARTGVELTVEKALKEEEVHSFGTRQMPIARSTIVLASMDVT